MSKDAETIMSCLELVAEKSDDLAPDVYRRFFALYPQGEELFGVDTEDAVKGRMIMSLLEELMRFSADEIYSENIKRWVHDHRGYGVTLPMYKDMFDCLLSTLQEVLGDDWTEDMNRAWLAQYEKLIEFLDYIYKP